MRPSRPTEPIDYLAIGHVTVDRTPFGPVLGGTVTYASLTARALGLQTGLITSWGEEADLTPLASVPMTGIVVDQSTTFENVYAGGTRRQTLHGLAQNLDYYLIPETWRSTPIVHLAPVAQEVEPGLVRQFPGQFVGATLQGWLRAWDSEGRVRAGEWPEAPFVLGRLDAALLSMEDVGDDLRRVHELAALSQLLVATDGPRGAHVYWRGESRHFPTPQVEASDETGAGDIFAAVFFVHYHHTENPWEAAELATRIASLSTTRSGLKAVPKPEEIQTFLSQVHL